MPTTSHFLSVAPFHQFLYAFNRWTMQEWPSVFGSETSITNIQPAFRWMKPFFIAIVTSQLNVTKVVQMHDFGHQILIHYTNGSTSTYTLNALHLYGIRISWEVKQKKRRRKKDKLKQKSVTIMQTNLNQTKFNGITEEVNNGGKNKIVWR